MLIAWRRGGWAQAATMGFMLGGMTGGLGSTFGLPWWSMILVNCLLAVPLGRRVLIQALAEP